MKKCVYFLFFVFTFLCANNTLAAEIYCKPDYIQYTDSSGNQKCKKSVGNAFKEFNQWYCVNGSLVDNKCYLIEEPLIDGCESNYEIYSDESGNQKCKKKLDSSGITQLIEKFCKENSSCEYLKTPNKGDMKCQDGYTMYTDYSGNQKCKKDVGKPYKEFNKWNCTKGSLIDGRCYSITNPIEGSNGCELNYSLYTSSSGQQMCKKQVSNDELTEIMVSVCASNPSECDYIKEPIKKTEINSSGGNYIAGEEQHGCEVVPDVVKKWIKISLNMVKYVALILVIVLGTLDFIKAAGSGEADSMKKAGQAFLKRVVAVILLFLLPMLVELILDLINLYGSTGDCFGVLE